MKILTPILRKKINKSVEKISKESDNGYKTITEIEGNMLKAMLFWTEEERVNAGGVTFELGCIRKDLEQIKIEVSNILEKIKAIKN